MRKTVVIVSWLAQQCIDNCPPPLLLSTPPDNGLVARKIGHPLAVNSNNILSAILSHSPCGLSALIDYRFLSEPGPRNDDCPTPNLFSYREKSWAFDSHSFLLSFDLHEMSLNNDIEIIRPVNFSGSTLNLVSNSWTLLQSCNVVNPGKIFHSNSIGSPSIVSKALSSGVHLNHSNLCSHAVFHHICS